MMTTVLSNLVYSALFNREWGPRLYQETLSPLTVPVDPKWRDCRAHYLTNMISSTVQVTTVADWLGYFISFLFVPLMVRIAKCTIIANKTCLYTPLSEKEQGEEQNLI